MIGRWGIVDPLAEKYLSFTPYAYVMNNPLKYADPNGMPSTHTDEDGNVIAVYEDGDLGVYRHDDAKTKKDVDAARKKSGDTGGGGEKMGETEYWDEFIIPGTNRAAGNIIFSDDPRQSWDALVEWVNNKAFST